MGGGEATQDVSMTQTNPKVPKDMQAIADMLAMISGGAMGAPVNFGSIPGLDANKVPSTVASMGDLFSKPAFGLGAKRLNPMGNPRTPSIGPGKSNNRAPTGIPPQSRNYGDIFARRNTRMPAYQTY